MMEEEQMYEHEIGDKIYSSKHRKILSHSQMITFISKYKEWYDQKILGNPIPDNIYFQTGTACHNFMEQFFKTPLNVETIADFATKTFAECWESNIKTNTKLLEFIDTSETDITLPNLQFWLTRYIQTWVQETQKLEVKYGAKKALEYNSPTFLEEHIVDTELGVQCYIDAQYDVDKWHRASRTLSILVPDVAPIEDYKTSQKQRMTVPTDNFLQTILYSVMKERQNKRTKIHWGAIDFMRYNCKYFVRIDERQKEKVVKMTEDVHEQIKYILSEIDKGNDMMDYKHGLKLGDYI